MENKKSYTPAILASLISYALFVALIIGLKKFDVRPIGPQNTSIGFASLNENCQNIIGVDMGVYRLTEYLGYAAIGVAVCFTLFGLGQLIHRRSFAAVDRDLYMLALLYIVCVAFYIAFEKVIINYRPVLVDGVPEASFPSSHTMMAVVIMGSAIHQLSHRISKPGARRFAVAACWFLMAAIVYGRVVSGVHWATDIIGGLILATGLILSYIAFCRGEIGSEPATKSERGYRPKH